MLRAPVVVAAPRTIRTDVLSNTLPRMHLDRSEQGAAWVGQLAENSVVFK
jgi:hypothetical protein